MKTLIFIFSLLTVIFSINFDSFSQWSSNPANPLEICNEPRPQREPCITQDGSGGYFVFWVDERNYSSGQVADLYGQRLNSNGIEQWEASGKKITDSIPNYIAPQVYYMGNGNAIVIYNTTNSGNRIWARKINSAGNDVWTSPALIFQPVGIHIGAEYFRAVSDGSNGLIISYQTTFIGGADYIFAQRMDGDGNLKWNPSGNGLNLSVNEQSRAPEIVSDGRGGANIFWYKVPGPYLIHKTHIDSSGNFLAKDTLRNTGNNFPQIKVVADGMGGAVLTWGTIAGVSTSDVYAQRIDIMGNEMWDINGVPVCNMSGAQYDPDIEITSDGNFIIAWKDERISGINNSQVYAQKYSPDGIPQWTPNGSQISNLSTIYPHPDMVSDNAGGVFLFMYNIPSGFCVTRVNGDSTFYWNPPVKTLAEEAYKPFYQKFKPISHSNGAAVVWQTFNSSLPNSFGIYGALIRFDGTTNVQQLSNEVPEGHTLKQNYPNPFNPKTIINYELGITNFVKLKVYDVLGNEVATLVNEKQSAGTYSVDFDGSGFASGVYFYKLEAGDFAETKRMVLLK